MRLERCAFTVLDIEGFSHEVADIWEPEPVSRVA